VFVRQVCESNTTHDHLPCPLQNLLAWGYQALPGLDFYNFCVQFNWKEQLETSCFFTYLEFLSHLHLWINLVDLSELIKVALYKLLKTKVLVCYTLTNHLFFMKTGKSLMHIAKSRFCWATINIIHFRRTYKTYIYNDRIFISRWTDNFLWN